VVEAVVHLSSYELTLTPRSQPRGLQEHFFPQYGFLVGLLEGTSILTCPMVPCYFDPGMTPAVPLNASPPPGERYRLNL
jgi:hypothetical protein